MTYKTAKLLTDAQGGIIPGQVYDPETDAYVLIDSDNPAIVSNPTEDVLIGAVDETAPATDTASSGLNGRLQRIAQRITSLLGTQGTGASYNPPAGGSGLLGPLSGIFKQSLLNATESTLAALSAKIPASLGQKLISGSLTTVAARGTNSLADALNGTIYLGLFSVAAVAGQNSKFQMINPAGSGKTVLLYTCNVWGGSGTNTYSAVGNDTPLGAPTTASGQVNCTMLGGATPTTTFYKTNDAAGVAAAQFANTAVAAITPQGTNILLANGFIVIPAGKGLEIDCNTVNITMNLLIAFSEIPNA